jgi:PAS domain S-box-containing protein
MMNNTKMKTSVPLKGLKVTQIVHAIAILVLLILAAATSIKTGHYLFDSAAVFILSLALIATAALIPITFRSVNSERRRRSMLKRYEAVVKSANDAIFLVSHDQFIVEANERACLMYGYAAEEFWGLKIADLRIPEAAKLIDSDLSSVNAINTKLIETIHRKKDGTSFPVEVSVQRLELDQKQYFMGIVRDVTERKRAEEELKQSRSLLNAIVQGTLDCVFVKELTGRYVLMNEALFKVLGKRDEEVIGKTDFEIFSEKEAVQMFQIDQETLQKGTIQAFEEEVKMPDGRHSYLTIKGPVRDSAGIIIGLFGIARDITARKEHEEQLRKLQLAVDQSPASIMITDAQGIIEYVNRRFTEVTQYETNEVVGNTPKILSQGSLLRKHMPSCGKPFVRETIGTLRYATKRKMETSFGRAP